MAARRFTVITGGVFGDAPGFDGAGLADTDARPMESWSIDLCRPGQVVPEAEAAWRALLTRTGVSDPFADPDYLQAAARHGAGGREVVFALAWGRTGARRTLCGAIPLTMPNPIWGHGRIGPWQPYGSAVTPAVEAPHGDAVQAALLAHLRTLRRGASLDLALAAPATRPVLRPVPDAVRIPAHNLFDVGGAGASSRERIVAPDRIRDAVEEFLILDAAHAAAPIIGDPSEAALVRVVTRLFARRRQAAVDLTRRDGRVVAAALHLGTGPHAVAWRRASEGMAGTARLDRSA
ncbi:hypothetical protein FV218_11590 [Methylobacterium sp. WL69]|uniref:hypothetical protein n=1 Tax=Methylobacterium sp. WL69 TaxID=2603893 RepID=UPI0011CC826A|nr:hypothetical protein [Methylobacterium sp. WL69]TXM73349.1 hypothetical protein FV218_11590 [Methylobacterium sp. WL69]